MRITRLELHGFKSFADRTVFKFGEGISCVVGPNGCGKSNVVDAMRWCIGEQSAKSLRGGAMLDVIFAGSAERKPVGYAEVGITFTSEGGEPFPGEYARFTEIQVARRLYRSGASEYLINQTRVRRKDILDLFMDTGVGNNLYSFIEQGRIDKIVSASAEDRRSLIDEAAGITRYKKRRAEAMSKLESTAGQLDRAADVADEMERRLRQLERQVVKAARFRRLRALVRQEEILLALVKYGGLAEERTEIEALARTSRERLEDLESGHVTLQEDLSVRQGEVEVASASVETARDALTEIDARRREIQAALSLQEQRGAELERQLGDARRELVGDEERMEAARQSAERAKTRLGELEDELAAAIAKAGEARTAQDEAGRAREAARAALREIEHETGDVTGRRAQLAARVQALAQREEDLPQRIASAEARLRSLADERVVLDKRVRVAEEVLAERRGHLERLKETQRELEEALDARVRRDVHARDAVRAAELELDTLQQELDEAVRAAESTAGQAEEEVAARVGRVQQQEDNRLREASRQDDRRIAEADAEARREAQQAEAAARATLDAARQADDAELAAWRKEQEAVFEAEDARLQAAIDEAVASASADLESAEERARTAMAASVAEARGRREEAEAKLEQARTAQRDLEARLAVAMKRRREVEGRVAALEAEAEASRARDAGGAAVARVAPDAPRLLDVLELDEAARGEAAALLGDQLLLPVLSRAVLGAAAEAARDAGATRVVVDDPAPSLHRLLGGAARVDDLSAAIDHWRRTGEPAVVPPTGERIDASGIVYLGRRGDEADAAIARDAELTALRASLATHVAEAEELEQAILAARARVEGAAIAARKATEAVDEVEREGRAAVQGATAEARASGEARVAEAREARAAWRPEARRALESQIAARVEARDAADTERRMASAAGLAEQREQADARLAALRAEVEEAREARRAEAERRVEEARTAAWDEVRATTEDVAVRRERLREQVGRARKTLEGARHRAEKAAAELAEARDAVTACEREQAEQDLVVVRVTAERDGSREQRDGLDDRERALEEERAGLVESLEDVRVRLAESRAALAEVEGAAGDAEARLSAARERAESREVAFEQARDAREAADTRLGSLRAEEAGLRATVDGASREAAAAEARLGDVRRRIGELATLHEEAVAATREASGGLDALATDRQEAAEALHTARTRFEGVVKARDEIGRRVREIERELGEVRQTALSSEQRAHQLAFEVEQLVGRIDERYQLDLPVALERLHETSALRVAAPEEARAGLEVAGKRVEPVDDLVIRPEMLEDEEVITDFVERIADHREKLGRIGDVNLTALEEYTELSERFTELDTQKTDLEESVASIRSAIATMNATCRDRFRETFDEVNDAFQRAYPELVGGGEARLELTDEEDLLETGVDILVRPPGKRMQHLGLLSGGEKAMTAIALLLALFTVKPSPFCVLDEVDAPLDEANGARFNDMIGHMSQQTQFIVITHNRKTMECADTLYGITMPSPGCSALVSVRVD